MMTVLFASTDRSRLVERSALARGVVGVDGCKIADLGINKCKHALERYYSTYSLLVAPGSNK
jgi:hypothetical protein